MIQFERNNAALLRNNDIAVLKSKQICIMEQTVINIEGFCSHHLTVDAPWYNEDNSLAGILGFSIALGQQPIGPALNYLRELRLLTPLSENSINDIQLTVREKECLDLLIYGKSYNQIAKELHRSPRTIEHCVEKIKEKFCVRTKFELIDTVLKYYQ